MKGVYCLLIEVQRPITIKVGSLGLIPFEKGNYIYVGSALNNLQNRVKRHLRKEKNIFWHIDYLLSHKEVAIKKIYYKETRTRQECTIARHIIKSAYLVPRFGCSDCRCKSHLFKLVKANPISTFKTLSLKDLSGP